MSTAQNRDRGNSQGFMPRSLQLFIVFVAGFLIAFAATRSTSSERSTMLNMVSTERALSSELQRENEILVMRLDEAEKSLQLLREDLAQSRQELLALERDNTFYKGLVSPEDLQRGFKLHRFDLELEENQSQRDRAGIRQGEQLYRYEVIVAHVGGRGLKLTGSLALATKPAKPAFVRLLDLEETTESADGESQLVVLEENMTHKLGFRFFQRVSGYIKLPEDFRPATIELTGRSNLSSKLRSNSFDLSLDWQELLEKPRLEPAA